MQRKWLFAFSLLILLTRIHGLEEDDDWDLEDLDADLEVTVSTGDVATAQEKHFLVDLTDQTAERVITSHEYVLLLGYASWCTRSQALMPEFAAAASALAGSVLLAKLDAVANPKTASLYNIKGFPTILFFINGSHELYPGGDTKEEIVNLIRKKTGSPASTVLSQDVAQELLRTNPVLVAGFFSKFEGHEYESFIEAAKQEIGTEFIQTIDAEVAKVFNSSIRSPPVVWIQKSEPEYFVPFDGSFTSKEVLQFIEINKYPLVVKLTSKNALKINSSPVKLQVLLFGDTVNIPAFLPFYQEVALKYKGKILFLLVDYSYEDFAMPMLSVYGLQNEKKNIVAGFNYENGYKYLLEKDINYNNLMVFCNGLFNGELPQYYKSEPVPSKNRGYLQTVVGSTFEAIVLDESRDAFLQVTTPWCAMCDAANKTFGKLATAFKHVPSIVIAQIDASANEHPQLQVNTYPAFLFYPAGKKSNPIIAPSKLNLKGLVQFVKQNAALPFTFPTEQTKSDTKMSDDANSETRAKESSSTRDEL